jgi:hypothetical protein
VKHVCLDSHDWKKKRVLFLVIRVLEEIKWEYKPIGAIRGKKRLNFFICPIEPPTRISFFSFLCIHSLYSCNQTMNDRVMPTTSSTTICLGYILLFGLDIKADCGNKISINNRIEEKEKGFSLSSSTRITFSW